MPQNNLGEELRELALGVLTLVKPQSTREEMEGNVTTERSNADAAPEDEEDEEEEIDDDEDDEDDDEDEEDEEDEDE